MKHGQRVDVDVARPNPEALAEQARVVGDTPVMEQCTFRKSGSSGGVLNLYRIAGRYFRQIDRVPGRCQEGIPVIEFRNIYVEEL